jgi:plastocyanin
MRSFPQMDGPTKAHSRKAISLGAALASALALLLAAGCGSSSSTGSNATTPTTTGAATNKTATTKAKKSGGLKVITTPKYAAPSASAPVQSGVVKVAYRYFTIQPDTLRVKVGSTVEWTNYDSVKHNVTSQGGPQSLASHEFGEGASYKVVLSHPGTIHYESTDHPVSMNGTIEVVS